MRPSARRWGSRSAIATITTAGPDWDVPFSEHGSGLDRKVPVVLDPYLIVQPEARFSTLVKPNSAKGIIHFTMGS